MKYNNTYSEEENYYNLDIEDYNINKYDQLNTDCFDCVWMSCCSRHDQSINNEMVKPNHFDVESWCECTCDDCI
jgi:hypothetical protein